ncbi:Alpha/Beta hydrolase protein [Pseudomassariella vexata]|uniref:Alpha/Beta hydrolase protein n=1 Tax=Pseudomassariella vexata TaxID=1141098 RepID=A0A1Y2EJU2_9PEZI|nr:Alpha/Beta hydrolase protein [Pseudomassariella vexata]ORY71833.1 Alpha/Beta hydrolase protein [Pseudomassariella vexata]
MTPASKPCILFVHGSWHTPKHFEPIRAILESKGVHSYCPLLRTIDACPPISPADDAELIGETLKRLIEVEERDVLLVGHSYGGHVASEAADANFAKRVREAASLSGGLVRIVFIAAFVSPVGATLADAYGGKLPPLFPVDEHGRMSMMNGAAGLYHDMPEKDQKLWTSELRTSSMLCPLTPLTKAGYLDHPLSYFFCQQDRALPIEIQRAMIKTLRQKHGLEIDTETLDSSHSPYLSQPETVADLLVELLI